MSKRLVVCCDGTWNRPDQSSEGRPCPTNVTKVAAAVIREDAAGKAQLVYYHPGVGSRHGERLRGGAFGYGLSLDVQSAYRFIMHNLEPDDELFFFGFSRGAYTARSTVGFVRNAGILRLENADRIDEAYALYRDRATHPRDIESQLFRRSFSRETRIRFIGVWDTVGALGIPWSGMPGIELINRRWQFHDTDLSTTVDAAFQALAIDEKRPPFEPAIWSQQPDAVGQRLEQVWFAGVHCDVGGGYPDSTLADIALRWMVDRARQCGLEFEQNVFTAAAPGEGTGAGSTGVPFQPDALGELHESRRGFYQLLPAHVRELGRKDPAHEHVASTAVERREKDSTYAPPGLLAYLQGPHDVTDV
jgi:uncharacterized protein (DUF2235 family)